MKHYIHAVLSLTAKEKQDDRRVENQLQEQDKKQESWKPRTRIAVGVLLMSCWEQIEWSTACKPPNGIDDQLHPSSPYTYVVYV